MITETQARVSFLVCSAGARQAEQLGDEQAFAVASMMAEKWRAELVGHGWTVPEVPDGTTAAAD